MNGCGYDDLVRADDVAGHKGTEQDDGGQKGSAGPRQSESQAGLPANLIRHAERFFDGMIPGLCCIFGVKEQCCSFAWKSIRNPRITVGHAPKSDAVASWSRKTHLDDVAEYCGLLTKFQGSRWRLDWEADIKLGDVNLEVQ
jgi:hypothetical protein